MPKLHVGFLLAQHPILSLKLIAQLPRQIRYPDYLPHQLLSVLDLDRIDFDPVDVIEDFIIYDSIHGVVMLAVKGVIDGIMERH